MVERGAGGMTIDAQIRRSVINGVPAWPIEEARALLDKYKATSTERPAMPSDSEIDALIERLSQFEGRDWETTVCYNGLRLEAAAFLAALRDERDGMERGLRTVQNAAKTIASAQGTELEHLRQNRTYDYKLRQEHESLLERDAQMTDALLTAEARVRELEQKLERARVALEPFSQFAKGLTSVEHDTHYIGLQTNGQPDLLGIELRHFRRARAALAEIGQRG